MVHLHVHSNFSFLDGGSTVEALVERARATGMKALALTDHDGLYGAVRLSCYHRRYPSPSWG
jgi:error-prone DNA polymerase